MRQRSELIVPQHALARQFGHSLISAKALPGNARTLQLGRSRTEIAAAGRGCGPRLHSRAVSSGGKQFAMESNR